MTIRRAKREDTGAVLRLLSQVLEIHAKIRPDIFVPGSTKYTSEELAVIFDDGLKPVYVAEDENGVIGYVFCVIKEPAFANTMLPRRTLFIDDFCVDEGCRGQRIGEALFRFVLDEAGRLGCTDVTLNVWEGNDAARRFYEKMGMKPRETQMEIML